MMIAGDTFRAGAVEQLKIWADKTGSLFYGSENTDPSGVIFDGLEMAKKEEADIVFIDTAGRLQNKQNLMKELEKRVKKKGALLIQLQMVNDEKHRRFYRRLGYRTATNLILKSKIL